MKNLVLGTAAVLALMACSKKTPEADTTTTTSGTQDTTIPVATPAPINNDNNATTPVQQQPMRNTNNFKDGGHVDTMGYDQGGPNGIGQPVDTNRGAANPTTTTNGQDMQGTRAPSKADPRSVVAPESNKVHGNGTTPGTTGQMNNNNQR